MERLTNGLGWFSIGLGLAQVCAPHAVANLIGAPATRKTHSVTRLYGLRQLAVGIGILTSRRPAAWLWARVAGDAADLSSLGAVARNPDSERGRTALAIASVAGVTAADAFCAKELTASERQIRRAGRQTPARIVRSIIIDRPVEEVYRFCRDLENLPRFMTYLQTVRYTGDKRTHWIAMGPGGMRIEWDAETIADEPNRLIAWRSVEGSPFRHSGSVRFERAPGNRGTLVRAEVDFSSIRGAAILAKILKMDAGRRLTHDLRNFKQVLEVGEVTVTEETVRPGMRAPQLEPVYQP